MYTMRILSRSKDLTNRFLSKTQVGFPFGITKNVNILRFLGSCFMKIFTYIKSSIWTQCASYRVLRISPIDSSRKTRWVFLLESSKTILYCVFQELFTETWSLKIKAISFTNIDVFCRHHPNRSIIFVVRPQHPPRHSSLLRY